MLFLSFVFGVSSGVVAFIYDTYFEAILTLVWEVRTGPCQAHDCKKATILPLLIGSLATRISGSPSTDPCYIAGSICDFLSVKIGTVSTITLDSMVDYSVRGSGWYM